MRNIESFQPDLLEQNSLYMIEDANEVFLDRFARSVLCKILLPVFNNHQYQLQAKRERAGLHWVSVTFSSPRVDTSFITVKVHSADPTQRMRYETGLV